MDETTKGEHSECNTFVCIACIKKYGRPCREDYNQVPQISSSQKILSNHTFYINQLIVYATYQINVQKIWRKGVKCVQNEKSAEAYVILTT